MKYIIDTDKGTCEPYIEDDKDDNFDEIVAPVIDTKNTNGYEWLDWYGNGYHPGRDYNRGSGNQDLGDDIYAVADGVVTYIQKSQKGFGNHFFIKSRVNHLKYGKIKFWCHFAHCSDILVKVGEKVKAGDLIAKVGNTGASTAAHLHFEIRKRPLGVNFYPNGKSDEWVKDAYYPPDEFLDI